MQEIIGVIRVNRCQILRLVQGIDSSVQGFVWIIGERRCVGQRVDDSQRLAEVVVCLSNDTSVRVRGRGGIRRDVVRILRQVLRRAAVGSGNGRTGDTLQASIV